jgi:hypothetical protein
MSSPGMGAGDHSRYGQFTSAMCQRFSATGLAAQIGPALTVGRVTGALFRRRTAVSITNERGTQPCSALLLRLRLFRTSLPRIYDKRITASSFLANRCDGPMSETTEGPAQSQCNSRLTWFRDVPIGGCAGSGLDQVALVGSEADVAGAPVGRHYDR